MYRRLFALVLLAEMGVVFAVHGFLGSNTRLMADDFCSINTSLQLGVLEQVLYWYRTWGGRYSVSLVDSFTFKTLGPGVVQFAPGIILLTWIIIMVFTVGKYLQREVPRPTSLVHPVLLGVTAVFATIVLTPAATKTLYWWNGMRTYIPALIIATLYIGFLLFAPDKPHTLKNILIGSLISFLLALTCGGFNESFTLIMGSLFSSLLLLSLLTKKIQAGDLSFYLLAAGVIGFVMALIFMVTSPGTSSRQALFPPPPDTATLFLTTVDSFLNYLRGIFQSPEKISAFIGLLLLSAWIGMMLGGNRRDARLIAVAIASGMILSFASLLPSVYATSQAPAARTLVIPTYILIVSFAIAGVRQGQILSGSPKSEQIETVLLICTMVVLSYSAVMNVNLLYGSRNDYISFAQKWDEVDRMIKQAKLNGETSVTIPAMDSWARLDRPNENPKFWATACYSEYYGIQVYGPPYGQ